MLYSITILLLVYLHVGGWDEQVEEERLISGDWLLVIKHAVKD